MWVFFFVLGGGEWGVEKSFLLEANDLSLKLGPFTNELSATVSQVFLFFCKQFLIWKMRNGLEMFPKFASSVNFPSLLSWQFCFC